MLEVNEARFWAKVNKTDDPDGCWIWEAACNEAGAGLFSVTDNGKQKLWYVPRIVWTLLRGRIPSGMHVLKLCGRASCCHPDHLQLGKAGAKITAKETKAIVRRRRRGERPIDLAEEFGLTANHVRTIVARSTRRQPDIR